MLTLDTAIRYFTEETHIMPCMSIACGTAHTLHTAHGGLADEAAGVPLTEECLFDLASLTKLFTGVMTMRLKEDGLLDLAAPVTRYAPQFAHLEDVPVDKVLGFEVALTTTARIDTQKDPADGRKLLFDIRPGAVTGRAYSDMHAMVLRHVLEGATGESYADLLHRLILRPLDMADTYTDVPAEKRALCVSCDGEHRIERGSYIVRRVAPGTPHDPKARAMQDGCCGHAGLFSTRSDLVKLCRGLLTERILPKSALMDMGRNRTGHQRPDGTWQQYLGAQCYVKHPVQYHSEVPVYESDTAIGLSGFTGHHLSVDVERGLFVLMLGSRCQNRLTVCLPEAGKSITDYGLREDGTGCITWPDGRPVWSSVDYVHHKDAHFHRAAASALGLQP